VNAIDPDLMRRAHAAQASHLRREQLFYFLWQSFEVLHASRGEQFVPNWHLEAMTWRLTQLAKGQVRRLLITMPPRHLKTITTSVAFVAWLLGHNPSLRIIMASYSTQLAMKNLADLRRIMESQQYRAMFPGTVISVSGQKILTSRGGHVYATSVGGTVTGIGADYIIADDLLKGGEASSEQIREEAFNFYQHSLLSRLDDKSNGRIVIVQQRLHEDDVAGRLLEAGGYTHLNLPAIAEEDEDIPIGDDKMHQRRVGDVLFPQRESRETLDQLRQQMGGAVFIPQYQQRTDGAGSGLFRWEWFDTYEDTPDRDEFNLLVQSVDTAFGEGDTNDYTVCLTFGRKELDWYLLDVHRTRDSYSDFKRWLIRSARRQRTDSILVEAQGAGIPLVRELTREHGLGRRIVPSSPRFSKQERFDTQIERLTQHKFLVPVQAPWLSEFRRELSTFPNARHDDQVDALTQFLNWLGTRSGLATVRRADSGRWR
jgi:predicted phage terminase large subunit-like protein